MAIEPRFIDGCSAARIRVSMAGKSAAGSEANAVRLGKEMRCLPPLASHRLVLSTTKGVERMAMLFFLTQILAMGITSPSMVTMLASSST